MRIKHPNCKLAVCCLLAAMLLPACGGGSSSSAGSGGTDSPTYQRGYAAGTVDTLDIVLADLRALQTTLAGSGAPAQTSRGALGRSFALLAPRQRETLAASLLTFITRVTEARNAANATGAGRDEAVAAQTAADEALQALQLVVVADTAARAGGGTAAETAAINALNPIAQVDATAPAAPTRINAALSAAVTAAEAEVTRLQRELAAAEAALGQQQVSSAGVVSDLRQRVEALQASLSAARALIGRGDSDPARTSAERVTVAYFPRTNASGVALAANDLLQIPTAGVAYAAGKTVLTARTDATDEYPVRGTVYRNYLRTTTTTTSEVVSLYGVDRATKYRLVRQGAADTRALRGSNTGWNNFHPRVRTSIRFTASGNPIVKYGSEPGEGHIYSDLERVQATVCSSITDTCNDATTNDIQITFGERTVGGDPAGEPLRYWKKVVPSPRIDQDLSAAGFQDHPYWNEGKATPCTPGVDAGCVTTAITANRRAPHRDAPARDSTYELLLSSYAPDLNGTAETADDTARYLSYASYGLWRFADAFWRNVYLSGAPFTYSPGGRIHTLHFGLDAFGTHNPLPTQAADSFQGTFEGATMGWIVHAYPSEGRRTSNIDGHTRLRGTVELTAHIGTIASKTNRVSGTIRNLEYWDGEVWDSGAETATALGGWNPRRSFNGLVVTLAEDDINAQGAFTGTTSTTSTATAGGVSVSHAQYWGEGEYEGAFYGPVGDLETAGTWFLPADDKGTVTGPGSDLHYNAIAGLVGSFGAACEGTCAPAP